jgi:hypothetical protein
MTVDPLERAVKEFNPDFDPEYRTNTKADDMDDYNPAKAVVKRSTVIGDLFKLSLVDQRTDPIESSHGVVICGQRGGSRGLNLDNSLGAVRNALEAGVKIIHLEVWVTGDDKVIVLNGGENGNIQLPNKQNN